MAPPKPSQTKKTKPTSAKSSVPPCLPRLGVLSDDQKDFCKPCHNFGKAGCSMNRNGRWPCDTCNGIGEEDTKERQDARHDCAPLTGKADIILTSVSPPGGSLRKARKLIKYIFTPPTSPAVVNPSPPTNSKTKRPGQATAAPTSKRKKITKTEAATDQPTDDQQTTQEVADPACHLTALLPRQFQMSFTNQNEFDSYKQLVISHPAPIRPILPLAPPAFTMIHCGVALDMTIPTAAGRPVYINLLLKQSLAEGTPKTQYKASSGNILMASSILFYEAFDTAAKRLEAAEERLTELINKMAHKVIGYRVTLEPWLFHRRSCEVDVVMSATRNGLGTPVCGKKIDVLALAAFKDRLVEGVPDLDNHVYADETDDEATASLNVKIVQQFFAKGMTFDWSNFESEYYRDVVALPNLNHITFGDEDEDSGQAAGDAGEAREDDEQGGGDGPEDSTEHSSVSDGAPPPYDGVED